MKTLIRTLIFLSLVVSCVVNGQDDVEHEEQHSDSLPLEQIKEFAEIFTRIKQYYVEPVSDEELLEFAVEGMLQGLDPHSVYLKEESLEELREGTTGSFGGLGMEVYMEDGFVKVIAPIDDSPAAAAGIMSGDLIIRIDDETVTGLSLNEATERMRGEPGTSVDLTIIRGEGEEAEPFELTLERAIVETQTVKRKQLSDRIGYLRVSQFQANTAESFRNELAELSEKPDFAGLIIDLRNNPGGLLNSAVSISDLFISDGVIVSTRGREEQQGQEFRASPIDVLRGKPIVLLINGGSASASEIIAGALQDHDRALVLGTESFGKGSVQTVMNVTDEVAIKLTTARYYTPSGRSIQAHGISPDILVQQRRFDSGTTAFRRIKEEDLPGHLENKEAGKSTEKAAATEDLYKDYQLSEAFNLISGLILYTEQREKVTH